ncbi:MAG: hypothetical protein RML32_08320, partial [Gammaproteobacteria bacterium]|nr:hypothetical protein [Gammaproteobacteria bacterium]
MHLTRTAADWVAEIASDGRDNVVVQALNEPDGYRNLEVLGLWCALAMREASRRRIRLALPNFAVGHPDEHAIMRGALDDLIVEFGRHPEHLLAVHEYFVEDPTREPYHVGRVQTLLKRFDFLRVPRPLVVVTECGRDVGGGRHDGWRDTGWGEIEYSNRLLSMARVHTQTGVYASCVFCYGPGFGNDWQSFNVDDAGTVLEAAERYN